MNPVDRTRLFLNSITTDYRVEEVNYGCVGSTQYTVVFDVTPNCVYQWFRFNAFNNAFGYRLQDGTFLPLNCLDGGSQYLELTLALHAHRLQWALWADNNISGLIQGFRVMKTR